MLYFGWLMSAKMNACTDQYSVVLLMPCKSVMSRYDPPAKYRMAALTWTAGSTPYGMRWRSSMCQRCRDGAMSATRVADAEASG